MKRKTDKTLLIFNLLLGIVLAIFSLKNIAYDWTIDWYDSEPYLWLLFAMSFIITNFILFYKRQRYLLISTLMFTFFIVGFCLNLFRKPHCDLTTIHYVYKGNTKNIDNKNGYSIYLMPLNFTFYKEENEMKNLNRTILQNELYEIPKKGILKTVYNDTLENTESINFKNYVKKNLSYFLKDSILDKKFEIKSSTELILGYKLKTVKQLEEVTAVLFKNGEFYRNKLLVVTPKMITDSAGIFIVNFGEINFE